MARLTRCVELRLVRGLGLANTRVKSASSIDVVSLFRSVSLWFSAEVHTSTMRRCSDRNLGYAKRDKNDPQLNACTSLAGSYSYPQATTAREIEGRSWWGVSRRRVCQATVEGSQNDSRCFRDFEHESEQHHMLSKSLKYFNSRAGA